MEMESLPPADHTETAEPEPASRPSSYRDAQVWKEIEAETGFASCADYLDFYKDVRPDFKDLLEQYRTWPEDSRTPQNDCCADEIVIYDLSKQENIPIDLSLRRYCDSGTELIQALREPPSNVCLQLVLWFWPLDSYNQEMTDALVLGLKLDPHFLRDLDLVNYYRPRAPKGFRASQIKDIVGNGIAATISQDFIPEVVNAVPVLLVASTVHRLFEKTLEEILALCDQRKPRIKRSALRESKPGVVTKSGGLREIKHQYAKNVENFIVQRRFASSMRTPTQAFLLLAATSPLLDTEAYRVRKILNEVNVNYCIIIGHKSNGFQLFSERNNDLDRQRLELRRTLEEAEDYVSQTFRYLSSEVDSDWSKEPSYVSIREDWKSLIDEARRLEIEVRDYMQLQVGNLSLEESRRFIELSNIQIRESKSGKIFTVLAFIYVPLNLATSIFGMNIQQLNQNGQNLWVFFTTAVVALALTGGSWLCSKSTYEAVAWYKEMAVATEANDEEERKREYGLLLRMAMLIWLVRNGYKTWMWRSGAWIAILLDSKVQARGFSRIVGGAERAPRACDYVSEFSQWNEEEKHDIFGPEVDVTWSPLSQ